MSSHGLLLWCRLEEGEDINSGTPNLPFTLGIQRLGKCETRRARIFCLETTYHDSDLDENFGSRRGVPRSVVERPPLTPTGGLPKTFPNLDDGTLTTHQRSVLCQKGKRQGQPVLLRFFTDVRFRFETTSHPTRRPLRVQYFFRPNGVSRVNSVLC